MLWWEQCFAVWVTFDPEQFTENCTLNNSAVHLYKLFTPHCTGNLWKKHLKIELTHVRSCGERMSTPLHRQCGFIFKSITENWCTVWLFRISTHAMTPSVFVRRRTTMHCREIKLSLMSGYGGTSNRKQPIILATLHWFANEWVKNKFINGDAINSDVEIQRRSCVCVCVQQQSIYFDIGEQAILDWSGRIECCWFQFHKIFLSNCIDDLCFMFQ